MDETTTLPWRTLTCRTVGCCNEGIPIELECVLPVYCGPCSQQITDVVEVPGGNESPKPPTPVVPAPAPEEED